MSEWVWVWQLAAVVIGEKDTAEPTAPDDTHVLSVILPSKTFTNVGCGEGISILQAQGAVLLHALELVGALL